MIEEALDASSDSSLSLHSIPDHDIDLNGYSDPSTLTPLMRASINGDIEAVNNALRRRFHVNTTNNQGLTALHFAVKGKYFEIVRLLVENDEINIDAQDWAGMTPLMHACKYRVSLHIIQHLLDHNANVHLEDNSQMTALWHAVFLRQTNGRETAFYETYNNMEEYLEFNVGIIEILTKHGADINVLHTRQETPITYVLTLRGMTREKQEYMTTALLYYGADPSFASNEVSPVLSCITDKCLYDSIIPYYSMLDFGVLEKCNIHAVHDMWRLLTESTRTTFAQKIERTNKNFMRVLSRSVCARAQIKQLCSRTDNRMQCNIDCLSPFLHELFDAEELYHVMYTPKMGRDIQKEILSRIFDEIINGFSVEDLLRISLCNYKKLNYDVYCKIIARISRPGSMIKLLEDLCVPIQQDRFLFPTELRAQDSWKMYMLAPSVIREEKCDAMPDLFVDDNADFFHGGEYNRSHSLVRLCRDVILDQIKTDHKQINFTRPFDYAEKIKSLACPKYLEDILLLRKFV